MGSDNKIDTNNLIQQLFTNDRQLIAKSIQKLHKLSITHESFNIVTKNFINPKNPKSFSMFIFDIFEIKNIGIIATGIVSSGTIKKGMKLTLQKSDGTDLKTKALDIEYFNNKNTVTAGETIGILLKNIKIDNIHQGDRLYRNQTFFSLF